MNFTHLCKNKTFLFILFFILTVSISYGMLYMKDKKIRDKENTLTKVKRCVLPSAVIAFIIVSLLYYYKGIQPEDVVLENEDYFN